MEEHEIWQNLKDMYLSFLDKEYQNNPSLLVEGLIYSVKSMNYVDYRSIDFLINSIDMYLNNIKDYREYLSFFKNDNLLHSYEEKLKILMASLKDKYSKYLSDISITNDIYTSLVNIYNRLVSLNKKELSPVTNNLKVTINTYERKIKTIKERQSMARKLSQLTLTKLNSRYELLSDKVNKLKKANINTDGYMELLNLYSLEIRRRKEKVVNEFPYKKYEELKELYLFNKRINSIDNMVSEIDFSNIKSINILLDNNEDKVTKISNKLPNNNVFSSDINTIKEDFNSDIVMINGMPLVLESMRNYER